MLNKQNLKELFLYLIVGVIATISEWGVFYLTDDIFNIHYMFATIIAYILSTFVNWIVGRLIVFKNTDKSIFFELFSVYMASIIGLLLNLLIMWFAVGFFGIQEMISKIIATCLVFIWNFLIRKLFIYKKNN